ncbi:MAG: hypothetical protein K6F25_01155 [Bacteroidales bacterium]|nr:hypothetical protein [Bacteroidales bacterium]
MAEPAKSKRDAFLSGRYPDRQFADDEELFGQVGQDFDNLENERNTLAQREKEFSDFLSADPRNAGLLMRIKRGEDPLLWLVRQYGPDITERAEDPKFQKELEDARKEYLEKFEESKKLDDEYASNIEATNQAVDDFAKEAGDEAKDAVMNALSGIVHDYICGKVSPETLRMVSKALNYDNDISAASQDGEVRGRNAKIDEKLRKASKGDGTEPLGTAGAPAGNAAPRRRSNPIFDIAAQAK